MTHSHPKKGDLVSYHTSQLDILGPCQGALGIVIDGPDKHGKMAVRWLQQTPLDRLFVWNSVKNLHVESPHPSRLEPAPKSCESAAFLEPAEGEKCENDDLF